MSTANLKKFLKKLDKDLTKSSDRYRKLVANKREHTLTISTHTIMSTLETLFKEANLVLPRKSIQSIKKEVDTFFENVALAVETLDADFISKAIDRQKGSLTVTIQEDVSKKRKRDNFTTLKKVYETHLDTMYSNILKILGMPEGIELASTSNKEGKRLVATAGQAFNLEHDGLDQSNIKYFVEDAVYKSLITIPVAARDALMSDLATAGITLDIIKNPKDNKITVFLGSQIKNVVESSKEQAWKREFQKEVSAALAKVSALELGNLEGSDSLVTTVRKRESNAINKVLKTNIKSKNVKVKAVDEKLDLKVSKASMSKAGAVTKGAKVAGALKKKKLSKNPEVGQRSLSLNRFIPQINSQLASVIERNMGEPRLESRTGRFAGSARVLSIDTTQRGFPSIAYTYQKNPYQTFEPGFRQGNSDRDPRVVIEQSIRELATSMMQTRFYMRRL